MYKYKSGPSAAPKSNLLVEAVTNINFNDLPKSPKAAVKEISRRMAFQVSARLIARIPEAVRARVEESRSVAIEITDERIFRWLARYLSGAAKASAHSSFRAEVVDSNGDSSIDAPSPRVTSSGSSEHARVSVALIPLPKESERYSFVHEGVRFTLEYNQEPVKRPGESSEGSWFRDRYLLRVWDADAGAAKRLLESVAEEIRQEKARSRSVSVYSRNRWGDWDEVSMESGRPLNTVVLDEGVMEEILADMEGFLADRQWYKDHGIPYRRSYMLYGPPGTGKSTTAKAVAGHFGMDMYGVSLSDPEMTDSDLRTAFFRTNPRSIILLEDIDALFDERKKGESNASRVTFSGLLNVLDGVAAQQGRVVFGSTNHIDRLDPALTRKGRFDVHVYIGLASSYQLRRMFLSFYPGLEEMADRFAAILPAGTLSPVDLQDHFVTHRDDPEGALANAGDLLPGDGAPPKPPGLYYNETTPPSIAGLRPAEARVAGQREVSS